MGVHIHINPENGGGSGGGSGEAAQTAVATTYADLLESLNAGNLVPGTWYRITDYACTTVQENTQSAGHAFDIIILAVDESHLNENAFAALHEGDTYFAGSNLEAWELKYCIDNDTNRFAWADDTNGKGVVYWMKDEFGNECPYDFKNIQFVRDQEGGGGGGDDPEPKSGQNETYYYTFSAEGDSQNNGGGGGGLRDAGTTSVVDASLNGIEGSLCSQNVIMAASGVDENNPAAAMLNDIVFINDSENGYFCVCNTFGSNCQNNSFGSDCRNNSFGSSCQSNSFGSNCVDNTFGSSCGNNSFGSGCFGNTFGSNCWNNSFGSDCVDNTFGSSCQSNSFGSNCQNNSFGSSCQSNSFGSDCFGNTFGSNCQNNSFGSNCQNNSFGSSCGNNSFGSSCWNNSFGSGCEGNEFVSYCRYNTVFDGVKYCSVGGHDDTGPTNYLQNTQILNETAGTSSSNKLTVAFYNNASYSQFAGVNSNGVLKIWTPADLVQ